MARKYKYFQTILEHLNGDCYVVYDGASYQDALQALSTIIKGYIQASNIDDTTKQFIYGDDPTFNIIKTKGWAK